ncbi:MAG: hypothetical protein AAFZ07_11005 [Actinomycetota bacterium]
MGDGAKGAEIASKDGNVRDGLKEVDQATNCATATEWIVSISERQGERCIGLNGSVNKTVKPACQPGRMEGKRGSSSVGLGPCALDFERSVEAVLVRSCDVGSRADAVTNAQFRLDLEPVVSE